VEDPRLAGSVVEKDELVAVAAAGDPLAAGEVDPGDLAGRAFVLREEGSATRRAVEEGLGRIGVRPPRVAMELGSNAAVAGAVAAGTGLGVVPERTVEARPGLGRLSVRGLRLSRPFVLAVERGRPLSPAAETFVEICGEKPGKKRN
jgi:DNA-binding transcriptional LysR family regulator